MTATAQRISTLLFIVLYKKHQTSPDKPRADLPNLTQPCAFIIVQSLSGHSGISGQASRASIDVLLVLNVTGAGAATCRKGGDIARPLRYIHLLDDALTSRLIRASQGRLWLLLVSTIRHVRRTYSAVDCLC